MTKIFSEISGHMIKGMMIHSQLADYHYFLNLPGYACCHEYHFWDETANYRKFTRNFIYNKNVLLPETRIETPDIIPKCWYNHKRQDLSETDIKMGVKNGLDMWIDWEKDTKCMYERMYKELLDIGNIYDTIIVKELLDDVSHELQNAESYQLSKEAIGYDLTVITSEQDCKKEKYLEKIKEVLDK